ncbi:MAG: addiction module protein [Chthoniobacterales bacterium]|nr:addiction module protein [Chthoniobacterales bacterium]
MASSVAELVSKALALPKPSRAFLAEKLLESLDREDDFPVSQEWLEEIRRRCDDIDSGKTDLIAAEEVFAQIRARLK